MDDLFTKKVRAAAAAGWWTLLIAYCILLIQWLAYMLIMAKSSPRGCFAFGVQAPHGRKFALSGYGQWWHSSSA
jgi:hypothetical protein